MRLFEYFPEEARALLEVKGVELIDKLGADTVAEIAADILTGVNVRSATEALTRRRISTLNAGLLVLFLRATQDDPDFPRNLPTQAREELLVRGTPGSEKRVLQWLLGLTKKQIDNVLRADDKAWEDYLTLYADDLSVVSAAATKAYGNLTGELHLEEGDESVPVGWLWALYLMTAIGSQTLATRGSEKSMYGKFFEKMVLGGVLHVLGLTFTSEDDVSSSDGVFWLSSRGEKRESDATALFAPGKGIRFDIGFIGPGNTEISLDKVSRFERQVEIEGQSIFMKTIILVDRIGTGSRIPRLAKEIDGALLQMSASYWPRELADEISEAIDEFDSPFIGLNDQEVEDFIRTRMKTAPFSEMLKMAAADAAE